MPKTATDWHKFIAPMSLEKIISKKAVIFSFDDITGLNTWHCGNKAAGSKQPGNCLYWVIYCIVTESIESKWYGCQALPHTCTIVNSFLLYFSFTISHITKMPGTTMVPRTPDIFPLEKVTVCLFAEILGFIYWFVHSLAHSSWWGRGLRQERKSIQGEQSNTGTERHLGRFLTAIEHVAVMPDVAKTDIHHNVSVGYAALGREKI